MEIRKEKPGDIAGIYSLNESVFESDAEAGLVDALRENVEGVISLVATDNEHIIGHIMFSPVSLAGGEGVSIYGLAPMAVESELQNQGIGTLLVEAGLKECMSQNIAAVFVLGHPAYYPRFGFKPSHNFGIKSEYDVPTDVFMGMELVPGSLESFEGVVKYSSEFGSV